MGCDIHAFVEHRKPSTRAGYMDEWDSLFTIGDDLFLPRHYGVFGQLAGVRREGNKVEPRGIPPNACHYTKAEYEMCGADAHTPSWLTPDEFEAALDGMQETDEYRALLAAMREMQRLGSEARIVFWFDN